MLLSVGEGKGHLRIPVWPTWGGAGWTLVLADGAGGFFPCHPICSQMLPCVQKFVSQDAFISPSLRLNCE